jgi:hypothetical protein
VTDSKSVPFGGAGSNPADVFFRVLPNWRNGSAPAYGAGGCGFEPHVGLGGSRSSVGRSSASHAEGPGFDPLRELAFGLVRGRSCVQSAQRTRLFRPVLLLSDMV